MSSSEGFLPHDSVSSWVRDAETPRRAITSSLGVAEAAGHLQLALSVRGQGWVF